MFPFQEYFGGHCPSYKAMAKTAKTSGVKKRMTGECRRAQIVSVATELFAKKGFKGTTTREIASKARISEAVIFKHFARKEDLYKAIIDSKCSDSKGQPLLFSAVKDKKGREIFRALALYLFEFHQKDYSFMRLLTFSALEKHNLSELFIKTKGLEVFEFLTNRIKELMKEGVLRKVDPEMAARAFIGMVLYHSISQELYGFKKYYEWPSGYVADSFVDIFFEGIKKR